MIKDKSEFLLDTEYYGAYEYEVEEEAKDRIPLVKIVKPLMVMFIIGILIFVYIYYIRNNLREISAWLSNVKQVILLEEKKVIRIREEVYVDKVKKEKIVSNKEIKKEKSKDIKPTPSNNNELTDEYLKLVEKSLGNY